MRLAETDHAAPVSSVPLRPLDSVARLARLDALRGVAMVWMTVFHFCFDLNQFHLIPPQSFNTDPVWFVQRWCIVSLFLLCAGFSQAVAQTQKLSVRRFWQRWARIALCAVCVSAGSALMFPDSWIRFGILHSVAVMLILVRWLPLSTAAWAVVACLVWWAPHVLPRVPTDMGFLWQVTGYLSGLLAHKPRTEDYVPLLPWLGWMAWGMVMGQLALRHGLTWLQGPLPPVLQPLARLGRWSLSYYMVHQPVLMGGLMLWQSLFRHTT